MTSASPADFCEDIFMIPCTYFKKMFRVTLPYVAQQSVFIFFLLILRFNAETFIRKQLFTENKCKRQNVCHCYVVSYMHDTCL